VIEDIHLAEMISRFTIHYMVGFLALAYNANMANKVYG
jgi:hypothetical protein